MRNLGTTEIIIIAVLIILLFGFKKLPDAARSIGRSMRVFKSEMDEMKTEDSTKASTAQRTVEGRVEPTSAASSTVRDAQPTRSTNAVTEDVPRTDNGPRTRDQL